MVPICVNSITAWDKVKALKQEIVYSPSFLFFFSVNKPYTFSRLTSLQDI